MDMKKILICLGLLSVALQTFGAQVEWLTDVSSALDKARRENKYVLLDFTGSDWCGWCMRLKKEVFDQPAFAAFAEANLVLVEVDFPHKKSQDAALKEANERLAETYKIRGFPTVIILNNSALPVAQTGYVEGGPKNFLAPLERLPGIKPVDLSAPNANETGRGLDNKDASPRKPAVFAPIAPATPNRYDTLALKAISGSKDRRMALINNETFLAGETAKVKVKDGRVEVCCKEIREDSVLVTVDGKPAELKLGNRQ
jgi:thioredoxin-related protein